MLNLDMYHNPKMTENLDQLDENIVEKLSHRNKKNGLSENSKATYRSIIRDYNQFLADNELHVSQVSLKRYFDEIKGKYRAATLNLRKYALLKIIKAELGENNILMTLAIEKVFEQIDSYQMDKAVVTAECLTEDEVETIIEAAQSLKTKLLVLFLFKTGCRVSEMIHVRLTDCEPTKDYIKVRILGKGNKERKVYISNELYEEIRAEYQGEVYLFESRTGDQLKRNNVFVQIRLAGRRAGFTHVHPHMLRHARATDLLLNKEISLKAVSKYLGHASTAVTADMYIHDDFSVNEIFSRDRF
ncbi:MAG: tyrosine-type recombinase/integrase [Candidatus Poribacteria bacterium]|nr:tyrosine-type recombinase/integrase [Candidatus Poribacteria bacterium]